MIREISLLLIFILVWGSLIYFYGWFALVWLSLVVWIGLMKYGNIFKRIKKE